MIKQIAQLFNDYYNGNLTTKQIEQLEECFNYVKEHKLTRLEMISWVNRKIKKWPTQLTTNLPKIPDNCGWKWVMLLDAQVLAPVIKGTEMIEEKDVKIDTESFSEEQILTWLSNHSTGWPKKSGPFPVLPKNCGWNWDVNGWGVVMLKHGVKTINKAVFDDYSMTDIRLTFPEMKDKTEMANWLRENLRKWPEIPEPFPALPKNCGWNWDVNSFGTVVLTHTVEIRDDDYYNLNS